MLHVLVLSTAAIVAGALPSIHGERLFRLVAPNGRVSYALAAAHGNVSSRQPLVPVSIVVRQSCRVYLQGDLFNESDIDGAEARGDLTNLLSRDQIATYQHIVGEGSNLLRVSPGLASTLVRYRHGDVLVKATEPFNTRLHVANIREQARLLDAAQIDPHLVEALELLFGEVFRPSILVSTVVRHIAEEARDNVAIRSHADIVAELAQSSGLDLVMLTPPDGQSVLRAQLRLLDGAALAQMLDQLAKRLRDPAGVYVSSSAATLISREANARYYELSPAEYGQLQDLLARSLLDHRIFFAGDEALAKHHANLHHHWSDQLAAAVQEGGAFIVMDAERVIPNLNSKVERTFLEDMVERGVQVTPLSADRAGPRPIK